MIKKKLIITSFTGIAFLFIAGGIYAATKVVDEIRLENKAYFSTASIKANTGKRTRNFLTPNAENATTRR